MTSGRIALVRGFPLESSENYLRQHFDSKGFTVEPGGIDRADEKEVCVLFSTVTECAGALLEKYQECEIEGEKVELLVTRCPPEMERRFPKYRCRSSETRQRHDRPVPHSEGLDISGSPDRPESVLTSADAMAGVHQHPPRNSNSTGAYSSPLIKGMQGQVLDKLQLKREEEAARQYGAQTQRQVHFHLGDNSDGTPGSLTEKNGGSEKHTAGYDSSNQMVSLRVCGFGEDTDQETAEMFFENPERSGAGEFASFAWDEEKREAIIVFTPEVASRVLDNESLLLEGAQLQVRPLTPVLEETEAELAAIEVRGFKPGTTQEALMLYFESTKRSGGGKTTEVRILNDVAFVTFESQEVADRVLKHKDLALRGAALTVTAVLRRQHSEEYVEENQSNISTLIAEGLPVGTTEEQLTLFFESKKRADGGKVANVKLTPEQGIAHVTFEEAEVVHQVLMKDQREGLEFRKAKLKVRLAGPPAPNNNHEQQKVHVLAPTIVVKGFPEDVNGEELSLFFENPRRASGGPVQNVEIRPDVGLALVTFEDMAVVDRVLSKDELLFRGCLLQVRLATPADTQIAPSPAPSAVPQSMPDHHDHCTVQVNGLSTNITEETVTFFFENTRRSGGGKILNLSIQDEGRCAMITFESCEVAERVLAKKDLTLSGVKLQVCLPSMEHPSAEVPLAAETTIEVVGYHPETTEEALLYFFENEKRSGGGEVMKVEFAPSRELARVTFKESTVAQRVLEKDHLFLDGMQLEVRLHKEPKSPLQSPGTPTKTLVKVHGIHRNISKESFEDFFQNARRCGGSEIKEIHVFDHDSQTAVIEYHDDEAAHRVLRRESLSLFGATVTLSAAKIADFHMAPLCTVCVTGLREDVTEDTLTFYFENTKRSGGGDVESVKLDLTRRTAYVTFVDSEAAQRVCERDDLKLNGNPINVQMHHGTRPKTRNQPSMFDDRYDEFADTGGIEVDSCAINVGGVAATTQEATLKLYFENRRRSGGGEIRKIFHNKEAGVYTITFQDSEAVTRVLKKSHKLEDSQLDVQSLDRVPTEDIRGPTYPDQVLVRGLTPDITRDRLILHLEDLTGCGVKDTCFCLDPSIVLVQFDSSVDFTRLARHCCSIPMDGTMLGVEKCPIALKAQVSNITDIADDTLCLHFENKKRSGGCEGVKLDINRAEGFAIVTCPSEEVLHAILEKQHIIDDKELLVNVYCPALGFLPAGFNCRDPVRIPVGVAIDVRDSRLVDFMQSSTVTQKKLDDLLRPLYGCVDWSQRDAQSSLYIRCLLSKTDKGAIVLGRDWEENIMKSITKEFLSLFDIKEVRTLNMVWSNVREAIVNMKYPHEEVTLVVDENACQVTLLGYANRVDDACKEIEFLFKEEQGALERAAHTLTEKVKLRCVQLRALLALKFPEQAAEKWPKLQVTISLNSEEEVVLEGLTKEIMDAKMMMYESLQELVNHRKAMADLKLQLLATEETRGELVKILHKKNCVAVWETDGQDLVVYARSKQELDFAFEMFDREASHVPLDIQEASRQALSSKAWNDLVADMLIRHPGQLIIVPAANFSSVEIACLNDVTQEVLEEIGRFISQNTKLEKMVSLPPGQAKVIALHMDRELRSIESDYQSSYIEIEPVEHLDGYEFRLKGNQNGLMDAEARIRSLLDQVISKNHKVEKPGLAKYFYADRGKHFLEGVEAKNKVVIQMGACDTSRQTSVSKVESEKSHMYGPEEKCRVKDRNGPELVVYKGDLTMHQVDITVNAANRDLDHIGGLAKALAQKGGAIVQQESRQYIAQHGRLLDGQVVVTSAGLLPCRKLIHAVGPIHRGGHYDEDNLLYEVVYTCLEKATELKASTIALPAISTGVFHFPLQSAAKIIVEAINDYCKSEKRKNTLKEIHLVDNSTKTTDALQKAVEKMYGRPSHKYKKYEGKQGPAHHGQGDASSKPVSKASYGPTSDPMAVITPDGVTVTIVKGAIATQKVDAIVNTTSTTLSLKAGAVSASILSAAGDALQTECQQKHPKGVKFGEVAVTSAHGLQCRYVYHGSCPRWDSGKGGTEKALRALVFNSLAQANQQGLASIAIPAIGTGNLKVPAKLASRAMYEEVSVYSQKHAGKQTVKDVRFVIYDKDAPTLDAFSNELKSLLSGNSGVEAAAAAPPTEPQATATASSQPPRHQRGKMVVSHSTAFTEEEHMAADDSDWETIGADGDVFGEVDRSASGQQQMYVGPILLQVQQGDITKETTDAIVNSCNKKLDLKMGAVSRAIAKAGGSKVLEECRRLGGIDKLIAVTSAGDLPCKVIIHLDAPHSFEEWRVVIKRCLEEAENQKLSSIAFPALGTGQISASADMMASLMMDTIAKFCRKKPNYLSTVRVTIFQPDMLSVFHEEMVNKGQKKKGFFKSIKDFILGGYSDEEEEQGAISQGGAKSKKRVRISNPNQISFTIYGLSKDNIGNAARNIDDIAKAECQDKVIGGAYDPSNAAFIKNLSKEQVKKIESLQQLYCVKITVDQEKRVNQIRVQGSPTDLVAVIQHIHNVFHEADSENFRIREAELLKDQIQWEYRHGDQWQPYPDDVNALVEKSYREQKTKATWTEKASDGKLVNYTINFAAKTESINGDSSETIEVRRKDLTDDSIPIPDTWEPMTAREHFRRCPLKPSDPEYQDVEKLWKLTLGGTSVTLTKVERIQNPNLYRRYMVHKQHLDEVNPSGTKNELQLWHGTAAPPIESINTQGFNRSYCGVNGVAFGNGVYFAVNSSYSVGYASPDPSGNRHMYLARVLVGQYTQGKQGMKVPPAKDPSKPNILFDSVVNKPSAPTMYIVFSDTQAYPEYLLTFK